MANTFKITRWTAFAFCIVCALSVLGMAAHQATLWLPFAFDRPYIIFTLVVSSVTVFILLMLCLRSQPRLDIFVIVILTVLWLALASYSADRVGYLNCESVWNVQKPTKSGKWVSEMVWCRETKAIMAFSWAAFGVLFFSLLILLKLVASVSEGDRHHIWSASMSELTFTGYRPNSEHYTGSPQLVYPGGQYGGQVVYQQPGHNVVIENGMVRQVPTGPL